MNYSAGWLSGSVISGLPTPLPPICECDLVVASGINAMLFVACGINFFFEGVWCNSCRLDPACVAEGFRAAVGDIRSGGPAACPKPLLLQSKALIFHGK